MGKIVSLDDERVKRGDPSNFIYDVFCPKECWGGLDATFQRVQTHTGKVVPALCLECRECGSVKIITDVEEEFNAAKRAEFKQ